MNDTLRLADTLSFAETHHLSNGEIFLIGFLGVMAFMLLLMVGMKAATLLARRWEDKNKNA
ncbi:MAG: hypothetical protein J5873_00080 [Bacteroidales bacterium]|nr:hypothetical protein [Bacteroidales bacterium]